MEDPKNQPTAGTPAAPAAATPSPVRGTSTGENFVEPPKAAPTAPAASTSQEEKPGKPTKPASGDRRTLTLSNQDLNDRIARAKKAELSRLFGTDDQAVIRQKIENWSSLEKKAEEERQATLSEQQKLAEERDRLARERDKFRQEAEGLREQQVVREQSSFVERVASKHVNTDALEEASLSFARYVQGTDPKVVAKWTEQDVEGWFREYVRRKPFMGKSVHPAGDAAPTPPPRRQAPAPAGSRTAPPRPAAPSTPATNGGKTMRPGQSNSMTRQEAKEAARRNGYSW